MNATDRTKPPTVAELQARAARLRRYTLPPLALGWAAAIAAVAVDHFRPGEYLILIALPVLGAATFGFVTGWPVRGGEPAWLTGTPRLPGPRWRWRARGPASQ